MLGDNVFIQALQELNNHQIQHGECLITMRFYFSYIFGNETLILKFGENYFYENYMAQRIETYISYRFEDIVVQYFFVSCTDWKKVRLSM